ncbi:MAG: hypothetical protein LBC11_00250 [Puniceicoccales bacterium]|jgi:hypothetical protein|nr:hypothetical protein [Puniceicoccales bacterium]
MEIKSSQDNQEIHSDTRTSGSSSIRVGDAGRTIFQKETETSSTQLSSRIVRLDVPFPKFLSSKGGSCEELARENFVNHYNGAKYLLAKYGYCHLVKTFISNLGLPQDVLISDKDGRLTLPDQVPEGHKYLKGSEKPLTADSLHMAENLIIKSISKEGDRNMVDAQGRLRLNVPRPELKGGRDVDIEALHDENEIWPDEDDDGNEIWPNVDGDENEVGPCTKNARENYRNYHTGMDYLVKKYGSRLVNEALAEMQASSGYPPLELTRDENGLEQLKPIQGNEKQLIRKFDQKRLQEFENLIIERGKWQGDRVSKLASGAIVAAYDTVQSLYQTIVAFKAIVATSDTGLSLYKKFLGMITKVLSLTGNLIDDYKLISEIRDRPLSKKEESALKKAKEVIKMVKTSLQTSQASYSLSDAVEAENPNSLDTAEKTFSFIGATAKYNQAILENLSKVAKSVADETIKDKTISPPVFLRSKAKIVYYADEENIKRENFEDFYNAVKYLVRKYGFDSIPHDIINELNALCGGNAPLVLDDQGQLQLPDSVPDGHREKPFTMKQLTHLENRITGQEGVENLKLSYRITEAIATTAGAIVKTVGAIVTGGVWLTIPGAISLMRIAYSDIQLVNELLQD